MKKLSYILLILSFCLVTILLSSCCGKCEKPENNDVSKDSRWKIKAEGIITDFKPMRGQRCRCDITNRQA